jgi:hypothetical protein
MANGTGPGDDSGCIFICTHHKHSWTWYVPAGSICIIFREEATAFIATLQHSVTNLMSWTILAKGKEQLMSCSFPFATLCMHLMILHVQEMFGMVLDDCSYVHSSLLFCHLAFTILIAANLRPTILLLDSATKASRNQTSTMAQAYMHIFYAVRSTTEKIKVVDHAVNCAIAGFTNRN